jgi:hypothetical protein
MKNINQKIILLPVIMLAMFAVSNMASASDFTGYLSTGVSTGVTGVVIAPPLANPTAGVYTSTQPVTLSADGSTNIYYTTDGVTVPDCTANGTLYSGPISVSSSEVIQAVSCYPNSIASTVVSYMYAIDPVSPSGGSSYSVAPNYGGGGGGGNGPIITSGTTSGTVGISDFVLLMANWGQTGTGNAADFNKDGKVDILDFIWLMANWTQ